MVLLFITAVGTVIGTLLAVEANSWMPYLSARLIRSTLDGMPVKLDGEMRSRWKEEIEGDLNSYADRPLGGLLFSLRLRRRGGRRLAAELMLDHTLSEAEVSSTNGRAFDIQRITAHFDRESKVLTYKDEAGRVMGMACISEDDVIVEPEFDRRLRDGETICLELADPCAPGEG